MNKIPNNKDKFLRKDDWDPGAGGGTQHYNFITPDLPKDFMDECMAIVEKLDKRTNKLDVVNWDERAEMDKVTKRSGQYLSIDEEDDKKYSDTPPTNEEIEAAKSKGKTVHTPTPKVKVSKKEQNLMDYLGGVMDYLGDE